jgi:hypothetical protein
MSDCVWRDCTTYRQGDKERIPHSFEAVSGSLRISITDNHIYYRGQWVMHCPTLTIKTKPLKAKTRDQACREAWKTVENTLAELDQDLHNILMEIAP